MVRFMSTLLKWFIFLLVFQVNTLGVCVCVCELSFAKPYDGIIIRLLVGFCFVIPEILPSYNSSSKCQAFIIPMTWAEKNVRRHWKLMCMDAYAFIAGTQQLAYANHLHGNFNWIQISDFTFIYVVFHSDAIEKSVYSLWYISFIDRLKTTTTNLIWAM